MLEDVSNPTLTFSLLSRGPPNSHIDIRQVLRVRLALLFDEKNLSGITPASLPSLLVPFSKRVQRDPRTRSGVLFQLRGAHRGAQRLYRIRFSIHSGQHAESKQLPSRAAVPVLDGFVL